MKALCLGLMSFFVLSLPATSRAQNIVPIEEDGHRVFVNADHAAVAPQPQVAKLVYWSTTERRWKQVPARGTVMMQQAQSAVADVERELATPQSQPGTSQAGVKTNSRAGMRSNVDQLIEEAAARHQVDPNLVRAVIKVESNFNPNAVSRKGAIGLMQLMPSTARMLNVTNPYDPEQNVDAGVRHLKKLLDTNSGDVPRSLAAYNAGQGAVERNGGVPPYAETRNYVRQITHLYSSSSGTSWAPNARPVRIARDGDGSPILSNVY